MPCADINPVRATSAVDKEQTRTSAAVADIDTDCEEETYLFGAVKWCSHNIHTHKLSTGNLSTDEENN